jgi:hypothetical protein
VNQGSVPFLGVKRGGARRAAAAQRLRRPRARRGCTSQTTTTPTTTGISAGCRQGVNCSAQASSGSHQPYPLAQPNRRYVGHEGKRRVAAEGQGGGSRRSRTVAAGGHGWPMGHQHGTLGNTGTWRTKCAPASRNAQQWSCSMAADPRHRTVVNSGAQRAWLIALSL